MQEAWNFRGYVAVPLETYGKRVLGPNFMSADEIEAGGFIEAVKQIVYALYTADDEVIAEFNTLCSGNENKMPCEMERETVTGIFDEFKRLYQNAIESRR